uniref:DUF6534 domain-containing protein n=1 Tax=Mycena chlorophos TaxID=658473 RepID=A0ABQ0L949_MYCCL|nr:predicted protein [Mycena chlorophos]
MLPGSCLMDPSTYIEDDPRAELFQPFPPTPNLISQKCRLEYNFVLAQNFCIFGPLLIGTILSTLFYGVMAAHMFTYYQRFKNDRQWIRYLLLYIFIIESLRIVVQVAITYQPLVVEFGSQQALIVSPLFVPGDAATLVLISTPVQIFTGWRISGMFSLRFGSRSLLRRPSVITGRRYLWALIAALALVSLGGGFSVSIFSGIRNEFREFATFNNAVILWFISSAVCDVFIAVILTHSLSTRKTGFGVDTQINRISTRKTGFGVDTQINRIVRATVQTGVITACGAIAVLVVFLVLPTTTLYASIPTFASNPILTCET